MHVPGDQSHAEEPDAARTLPSTGQPVRGDDILAWQQNSRKRPNRYNVFARPATGDSAQQFLDSWRDFMGPKMRTVCGVMTSPVLYGGAPDRPPSVSAAAS